MAMVDMRCDFNLADDKRVFDVKRVKIKSVDDYGENQCIDLEEEYSNIRRRPPRSKDRKHERQGQRDLESN